MTTKTKTKKNAKASKPRAKKAAKSRTKIGKTKKAKYRATSAIVATAIAGLRGQGVLRLGNKSKLELRDRLAMPRQMFGRIVNVSERTIADAEAGKDAAKKLLRTYNEVYRLWEALSEVVDPECLGLWFQTPNDSFDGLKPIEVIERGEIDRLWNMVFRLQTAMPG
jgi:DNA-binding XRE family transcriptional regulator